MDKKTNFSRIHFVNIRGLVFNYIGNDKLEHRLPQEAGEQRHWVQGRQLLPARLHGPQRNVGGDRDAPLARFAINFSLSLFHCLQRLRAHRL